MKKYKVVFTDIARKSGRGSSIKFATDEQSLRYRWNAHWIDSSEYKIISITEQLTFLQRFRRLFFLMFIPMLIINCSAPRKKNEPDYIKRQREADIKRATWLKYYSHP